MAKFDAKSFNPQAFKYSVDRVPNLKTNELRKSRALAPNADIRTVLSSQNGTEYARIAMKGLLDGDAVNYDGQTNITATSTKVFERGVVVVGRAKAWTEKDFSFDITGGEDFMDNVASQVAEYKEELDQDTILAVLKGIFAMTGDKNLEFVNAHTYDISNDATSKVVGATTLNSATNKACGANKKKFTMVFMHSDVATNLENLNLIEYLKYTDANGIQRNIELGQWGNKLVVIDDDMPTREIFSSAGVYTVTIGGTVATGEKFTVAGADFTVAATETATAVATGLESALSANADYTVTRSGAVLTFTEKSGHYGKGVPSSSTDSVAGTITKATTTEPTTYVEYTTYALGDGAIDYEDVGAKVPYEMDRNPALNGGEDTLYIRQRKVFAPKGISYEKASQVSLSPTDAELANGSNWALVHTGESEAASRTYINHKSIPICRIISRG